MKLNTVSLKNVERGFPVLAEQVLFAQLSAEVKPKKNSDGQNLEITCRILDEVVTKKDGTEMNNANGKLSFKYFISLEATEKYDPNKSLAMVSDAIKNDPEQDLELEHIEGAYVKVKLGIQAPRDGRDEQNVVKALLPIRDEDGFTPPAMQ